MLPCLMIEFNSANSKHIKLTYDVITLYIHLCKIEKEPYQKKTLVLPLQTADSSPK